MMTNAHGHVIFRSMVLVVLMVRVMAMLEVMLQVILMSTVMFFVINI